MKIWKILALSLVILILASSAACSLGNSQGQAEQQVTLTTGDLTTKVNGAGKIDYSNDANLSFGMAGKIEKLSIKKGDTVTKGTVLAQLETDNLELALSQVKVAEAQAQTALTQSQVALTQARMAQTQAEASVTSAQFALDKIQEVADLKDKIVDLE